MVCKIHLLTSVVDPVTTTSSPRTSHQRFSSRHQCPCNHLTIACNLACNVDTQSPENINPQDRYLCIILVHINSDNRITIYRPGMTPFRARSISLPLLGVSNLSTFLDPRPVMFADTGSSLTPLLFRPNSSLSLE